MTEQRWDVEVYYQATTMVRVWSHTPEEAARLAEAKAERVVKGIEDGSAQAPVDDVKRAYT